MTTKELNKWNSSRLKYWLDIVSDVALVWCGAIMLAIVLGIDIGGFL